MRFFQTLKNVNFMTNTEKKDSAKEPEWVVSVAVYFCLIRSSIAVGPTLFLSNSPTTHNFLSMLNRTCFSVICNFERKGKFYCLSSSVT